MFLALHPNTTWGFPGGSVVKNLPASAGDAVSIPGFGRSLKKEMATHSGILAWRIPWTEAPNGPQFQGCERIRHKLETKQKQQTVSYLQSLSKSTLHPPSEVASRFVPLLQLLKPFKNPLAGRPAKTQNFRLTSKVLHRTDPLTSPGSPLSTNTTCPPPSH